MEPLTSISEVRHCADGALGLHSELEGLAFMLRGELDYAVAQYNEQVIQLFRKSGGACDSAQQRGGGFEATAAGGGGGDGVPATPTTTGRFADKGDCDNLQRDVSFADDDDDDVSFADATSQDEDDDGKRKPPVAENYFCTLNFAKDEEMKERKSRALKADTLSSRRMSRSELSSILPERSGRCAALLALNDRFRAQLKGVVASKYFDGFFVLAIASNTMWFGVEAQYMASEASTTVPGGFKVVSQTYTILFLFELLSRLYSGGPCHYYCGPDATWNIFDTVLVGLSLIEWLVSTAMQSDEPEDQAAATQNLTYIRFIRIARMMRTLRIIRIFSFFRSLRLLLLSLYNTLKSLFWTVIVLLLILYMVGVLFTQAATQHFAITDLDAADPNIFKYYGTLPRSVYTLFKAITNGISWQIVAEPLEDIHWMWAGLFLLYISFTYFCLLNVVTGVFCQTAIENAKKDQDEVMQSQMSVVKGFAEQLYGLFRDVDVDESGELTLDEFEELFQDDRLRKYCASLDITLDDAWALFKLLDEDGSGSIAADEFVKGCLKLRGHARNLDLALTGYQVRWLIQRFDRFITYTDDQFKFLHNSLELQAGTIDARLPSERLCCGTTLGLPVARNWNPTLWVGRD